jgi:hypothetical protein
MSRLYIAEYATPDPVDPPIGEQFIELDDKSHQSQSFQSTTRSIRLHPEAPCSIAFGENPVATKDNQRIATDQTRAVYPGLRLAAIKNAGEAMDDTNGLLGLIKLITHPDEAKSHLEKLAKLRDETAKRQKELAAELKAHDATRKAADQAHQERQGFLDRKERGLLQRANEIDQRDNALRSRAEEHAHLRAELDAKAEEAHRRHAELEARERAIHDHEAAIAQREAAVNAREADYNDRLNRLKALAS